MFLVPHWLLPCFRGKLYNDISERRHFVFHWLVWIFINFIISVYLLVVIFKSKTFIVQLSTFSVVNFTFLWICFISYDNSYPLVSLFFSNIILMEIVIKCYFLKLQFAIWFVLKYLVQITSPPPPHVNLQVSHLHNVCSA